MVGGAASTANLLEEYEEDDDGWWYSLRIIKNYLLFLLKETESSITQSPRSRY